MSDQEQKETELEENSASKEDSEQSTPEPTTQDKPKKEANPKKSEAFSEAKSSIIFTEKNYWVVMAVVVVVLALIAVSNRF